MTRWAFVARFSTTPQDRWLLDAMPPSEHEVEVIPRSGDERSWHTQTRGVSGLADWRADIGQIRAALSTEPDGLITVFPQLASIAGLSQMRRRRPIISWFFNTSLYGGARKQLARAGLRNVTSFVVHHRCEGPMYAEWLGLPDERFVFVPMQFDNPFDVADVDDDDPFVFATGSGFRDYGTFFEAMASLGYPVKVVAGPRILAGLTAPPNVEILEGVDRSEIFRLSQRSRVNVMPLTEEGVIAGTVTMAQTLRLGRAPVITDRRGTDDYVEDGVNGLTVPPFDATALAGAIEAMWTDTELRTRLNAGAAAFGEAHLTDTAAARALTEILDSAVAADTVAAS